MKLRKCLAFLLALIMVIAMLPTAFAEGEEVVWDPTYAFMRRAFGDSTNEQNLANLAGQEATNKTVTTGVWSWVSNFNLN
ncbi:MAG: hypothetical protein IJN71_05955, partial [Oscillospiraceae bacterium]|nr:hypothetical protein [Oscillospiraceae bacterium]